ncbi:MAG: PIN domain-containing protein [Bifidobacteriaceae bacterium]|nr:PIN domain-containing protein [Bifidobacteriaceae bacterium]
MTAKPSCVLDASAVIAMIFAEDGHEAVAEAVLAGRAAISTANWAEVAQKTRQKGEDWSAARGFLEAQLSVEPVTLQDAEAAAVYWGDHKFLSLGDRICLALADRLALPALTADSAWDGIGRARLVR